MKLIVWGAGKFFVSAVNKNKRVIDAVVDSDVNKWGQWIAGYRVESPGDVLANCSPSDTLVIIFSPVAVDQIRQSIQEIGPFATLALADILEMDRAFGLSSASRHMGLAAWKEATRESGIYVFRHMVGATHYSSSKEMLLDLGKRTDTPGLWLEFGVAGGNSIRILASTTPETIYGFDSFEGLPEDWRFDAPKGIFSTSPPMDLPSNVKLVQGMFETTLPTFLMEHKEPVALLHIDSDLYSSAATIFGHLRERIVPGTIIIFDEYINYPEWQQHEYKAFQEYVSSPGVDYDYIGVVLDGEQVAVRIKMNRP
ncbi:MAG: class I SAM-dependent methyltransferase [Syntrophobacteraceae bacterium]